MAHPRAKSGADVAAAARSKAAAAFREFFKTESNAFAKMPGVSDLIEFSRSIHAEMDALLAAARARISPVGCTLLCTTYPCHSCARHLVAAGITEVLYIEPYTKSLAVELHSDSLQTQTQEPESGEQKKMLVSPYTGVGPRMYEDHFVKLGDLKGASGAFDDPSGDSPIVSVRLTELDRVEKAAAELV